MGIEYILTDKQFAQIEPLLREGFDRRGRKPAISDRDALEGILYILREGCRWRALPEHFGHWMRVFMRYKRWTERGVWWKVLMRLQKVGIAKVDITFMDSSVVRAHRHAAGARKKKGFQSLGRSKGGFSTKIHIVTDDAGRLWGIWLTGGQASDHQCAPFLANQAAACRASTLVADKGYDSDALRIQGEEAGMKVVIPPKSNRIIQYEYDKNTYRLRARVEQCFGKLKESRRVATRYDKLATHYLGFVILAAIRNILKVIC